MQRVLSTATAITATTTTTTEPCQMLDKIIFFFLFVQLVVGPVLPQCLFLKETTKKNRRYVYYYMFSYLILCCIVLCWLSVVHKNVPDPHLAVVVLNSFRNFVLCNQFSSIIDCCLIVCCCLERYTEKKTQIYKLWPMINIFQLNS